MDVRLIDAETRFASDRFRLEIERFATPDGEVRRPVIHHPGAVAIVAQPDPTCLLLVRQYRYSIRRETWEIPAGTRVAGEEPQATALRELQEEAGYTASVLSEWMRFYPAVGVSDEEMILYRAAGLSRATLPRDHGELVAGDIVPLVDLPGLVADGRICDAKTLIALGLLGRPMCGACGPC